MDLKSTTIECPHCGHHFHVDLDPNNGDQDYYEECPNCCNSVHLNMHIDNAARKIDLNVDADDEQIY